jgi:hypothetical protein
VHSIALSKRIVQHAQSMEDAHWRCHALGRLRLDGGGPVLRARSRVNKQAKNSLLRVN